MGGRSIQSHAQGSAAAELQTQASTLRVRPWYRPEVRYRWGWCFLCIMIWGSILSLDRLLTYSFQTLAANSFSKHSSLTFISVVRSVIGALAGPPLAILEQLAGSQVAWLATIVFYTAGHASTAASTGVPSYTAGITLYELGANGAVILQQILVARVTSSRDRQLFLILPQLGFLVWAFISSSIFSALSDNWRWGIALFAILGPLPLLPLVGLLHYTPPSPSKRINASSASSVTPIFSFRRRKNIPSSSPDSSGSSPQGWLASIKTSCSKADAIGLLLLGFGTAGTLVPIMLAGIRGSWLQPRYLAPLLVSAFLIIPAFVVWQLRFAPHPLVPRSLFRSRVFLIGCLAEIFFQAAFAGIAAYLPTYLYVVKGTSADAQQNVSSLFNFSYALGCLPISLIARYARRVKYIVVFGATLFTVGAAVLILSGPSGTPTLFRIIVAQILMGLGGSASMALIPSMIQIDAQRRWARLTQESSAQDEMVCQRCHDQLDSDIQLDESLSDSAHGCDGSDPQRSVPRRSPPSPPSILDSDVGKSIATLNIFQSMGAAIGGAVAGTIWSTFIPSYLTEELQPLGLADDVGSIFSAPLTWIEDYPLGTDARTAVIHGYNRVWKLLLIVFTAFLAFTILLALFMENIELNDGLGEISSSKDRSDDEADEGDQEYDQSFVGDLLGQAFFRRVEGWFRLKFRGRKTRERAVEVAADVDDSTET